MYGQEYLNQISASNKKDGAKTKNSFLSSKIVMIVVGAIVAVIIMAIIGGILGSSKAKLPKQTSALKLHSDYIVEMVDVYQDSLKSSLLRSYSSSLKSVLSETSKGLSSYLEKKHGLKKDKDFNSKVISQADTMKDALNTELFEAKINGILDRTFDRKMIYEISILMTEESDVLRIAGKDEELTNVLNTSYDSLKKLYDNFDSFSEAK